MLAQAQGKPANIEAVERLRDLVRASRILSDSEQRNRYDRLGEAGVDLTQIPSGYDLDRLAQLALSARAGGGGSLAGVSISAMINDLRILTDTDKD